MKNSGGERIERGEESCAFLCFCLLVSAYYPVPQERREDGEGRGVLYFFCVLFFAGESMSYYPVPPWQRGDGLVTVFNTIASFVMRLQRDDDQYTDLIRYTNC